MEPDQARKGGAAKVFCVVSVIAGVVALGLRLAFMASRSDIGYDLGLDGRFTQSLLHWAAPPIIGFGLAAAVAAVASSPANTRFGVALPGIILNGFALLMWLYPR